LLGRPKLLHLLAHLVHVPAKEARRLGHRPAVVEFVLEVADIGLGPGLARVSVHFVTLFLLLPAPTSRPSRAGRFLSLRQSHCTQVVHAIVNNAEFGTKITPRVLLQLSQIMMSCGVAIISSHEKGPPEHSPSGPYVTAGYIRRSASACAAFLAALNAATMAARDHQPASGCVSIPLACSVPCRDCKASKLWPCYRPSVSRRNARGGYGPASAVASARRSMDTAGRYASATTPAECWAACT